MTTCAALSIVAPPIEPRIDGTIEASVPPKTTVFRNAPILQPRPVMAARATILFPAVLGVRAEGWAVWLHVKIRHDGPRLLRPSFVPSDSGFAGGVAFSGSFLRERLCGRGESGWWAVRCGVSDVWRHGEIVAVEI
jgi:hypothetical protein